MRRTGDFLGSSERLPGSILRMKKCLHANAARPSPDALTSVQFHPNAQVVMTAGLDQSLSLFQIQSIRLEKFPVHRAAFSRDGETVIATRGALLLSGTRGYLHLLTLKTREVVSSMKINGEVVGVAFSPDGSKVFANSGCVTGTSIAASRDGRYLACGSQSGVVNVYSQEACLRSDKPRPLKAVMNLLTPVTALTFNPSSEILAMASRSEDKAVRMVRDSYTDDDGDDEDEGDDDEDDEGEDDNDADDEEDDNDADDEDDEGDDDNDADDEGEDDDNDEDDNDADDEGDDNDEDERDDEGDGEDDADDEGEDDDEDDDNDEDDNDADDEGDDNDEDERDDEGDGEDDEGDGDDNDADDEHEGDEDDGGDASPPFPQCFLELPRLKEEDRVSSLEPRLLPSQRLLLIGQ
ncbi:U3 small nucleolar RNA-associated protein 18 like [Dissostichus eleginoides]|uniref:U3 small nucleolar RNA-associated protein 18 like n=1 Tax=Dissostichus eleginoides TaxID=100907 RepID=A0AAD9B3T7_DISEL|nr:U3 small nucleolar RNA-associated protein 18 like [Dissostichus eleginoides]